MHTGLATPRALELAGVGGARTFEEHAEMVLDAAGAPTDELREAAAINLVRAAIPAQTAAERYRLYADALRSYAAAGLTGLHAMDGDLTTLELLRELEAGGDLATRIVTPFWISPDSTDAQWEAFAAARDDHGRRWRAGVAKFFIDGVIDSGTGWLFAPDSEGEGRRRSGPIRPATARACASSPGAASSAYARLRRPRRAGAQRLPARPAPRPESATGSSTSRPSRPDDLPRAAAEGVVASMQIQHMMELDLQRGRTTAAAASATSVWDRASYATPAGRQALTWRSAPTGRSLLRPARGACRGAAAPPRRGAHRAPYDDQCSSALAALSDHTSDAAAAAGGGDRCGPLRAGMAADVTVAGQGPGRLAGRRADGRRRCC